MGAPLLRSAPAMMFAMAQVWEAWLFCQGHRGKYWDWDPAYSLPGDCTYQKRGDDGSEMSQRDPIP